MSDSQYMKVVCTHCGKALKAPKSAVGKSARCPKCKAKVKISERYDMGDHDSSPQSKEDFSAKTKEAVQKDAEMRTRSMKNKRVLLVDDEPDLHTVLRTLLEAKQLQVLDAYDGQEGLEMAKKDRPDCIVMDAEMPKMNGFEACSRLKGDPRYEYMPIIMLTGVPGKSTKSEDYWREKSHADEFMTKPFDYKELLDLVVNTIVNSYRKDGDGQSKFRI